MDFGDSRTASQPPRIDREALIADITELGLDINIGLVHSSAVTRDLSIYEEYLENSSDSEHDEHGDSEHEFVTASRTSGENSNESGNESEDSVPYIILSDEHDDFTEFTSAESNRYDEWKPPEESKTSFSDSITQDEDVSIGNSEPNISSNKVTVVPNIPPLSQDKIAIIKSTMLKLNFTPRPNQDFTFSVIDLSKIRLGDEINREESK